MSSRRPVKPLDLGPYDLIIYAGEITRTGYHVLCEEIDRTETLQKQALLVLTTMGGDPHAGFRIARALQHHYESFHALIPWVCKSAGTLICVGASQLYLNNQSELGPLDVQVKKTDEVVGRSSGLEILQAVNYLQNQALIAFNSYLHQLTNSEQGPGLSTKVASEIASRLTTGLFAPVFSQIEPMRLSEMQRATDIAFAYGGRLNERSQNLREGGLSKLVVNYPSHSFVIDRKEAGTIFLHVDRPRGVLLELCKAVLNISAPHVTANPPHVSIFPNYAPHGENYEDISDPEQRPGGDDRSGNENSPASDVTEPARSNADSDEQESDRP